MTQLTPDHFEIIDSNKAKKYEVKKEQEKMRDELSFFVLNCNVNQLGDMYATFKRIKKNNT